MPQSYSNKACRVISVVCSSKLEEQAYFDFELSSSVLCAAFWCRDLLEITLDLLASAFYTTELPIGL